MAYDPNDPESNQPMTLPPGYGTGVMEMRPMVGSASGQEAYDVAPPEVHEAIRSSMDKQAANRASMLMLNPMDPTYAQKVGAHVAKDDLLKNDHEHLVNTMMPRYGGPSVGPAPVPGEPIPEKQLPQDEHKFNVAQLRNRIMQDENAGDREAAGQDRVALANEIRMNPWGSPGNHPGVLGKIGHVAGMIGQIAGGAIEPGIVQAIPGTQLNLAAQQATGEKEREAGEKGALTAAQTANTQAEAALRGEQETALENAPAPPGPSIQQQYADAEAQLAAHPGDPEAQKRFQMAQDAITGIQREPKPTEDKFQHVAGTVDGKPKFGNYDPLRHQFVDDDGNIIPNFVPPPNFAQAPRFTPIEVAIPGGGVAPGKFNTRTGEATPANPNAPAAVPGNIAHDLDKELSDARNADRRMAIMERNYKSALNGDQQAMLSLVANHIGMTLGAQKGARINQAVWNEAIASTPWLEGKINRFFHQDETGDYVFDGWKGGVTLTKPQMEQMVSLAREVRNAQWDQVHQMQAQYRLPPTPGGGTNAAPTGGGHTSVADWLKRQNKPAGGGP